ncbi:MAG TPA: prepilin-type N-terminal cleavage/methylation domain-containing protein [Planctomycetota bacterium]|jgi:general secretion pathway protein G|nr:prepilin-type N-terminal cleavage/methylation domain-containing protein [Planctomycetota bacterium]
MRGRPAAGFTLLELVVVLAILLLLAGLLLPNVLSVAKDARSAKILAVYDAVAKACQAYRADTAQTAQEFGDPSLAATGDHGLFLAQPSVPGWAGPYLDQPLSPGDNPFGLPLYCFADLTGSAATVNPDGFDLTGSGSPNATGAGNFLGFLGVPEEVARLVDDALDRGIPGTWAATGRVEYVSAGRRLAIFILDTDGR